MTKLLLLAAERFPLYASYFLNRVDDHSIQAPFAYSFYQLLKNRTFNSVPKIENARQQYVHSTKEINYHSFGIKSTLHTSQRNQISSIAKSGITDQEASKTLASIIQKFNATTIVELGTSLGINTCYLAEASRGGKVITFEGHEELCQYSSELFLDLGYDNISLIQGNIDETLKPFVDSLEQIDFVHIDAHHSKKALLNYFETIAEKLHVDSVVAVDDIRWSRDMYNGWKILTNNNQISHSFDVGNIGFLFFKEGVNKQHYIV